MLVQRVSKDDSRWKRNRIDACPVDSSEVCNLSKISICNELVQQVMHLEHVDVAFAHFGHKVEMIALGLSDPEDVIKQQFVAVARSQPLVGQTG